MLLADLNPFRGCKRFDFDEEDDIMSDEDEMTILDAIEAEPSQ